MNSAICIGAIIGIHVDGHYQRAVVLSWKDVIIHFFPCFCLKHRILRVHYMDRDVLIETDVNLQDITFPYQTTPARKVGFHLMHFLNIQWSYPFPCNSAITPSYVLQTYTFIIELFIACLIKRVTLQRQNKMPQFISSEFHLLKQNFPFSLDHMNFYDTAQMLYNFDISQLQSLSDIYFQNLSWIIM